MVSHFVRRLTLNLFHDISQYVYELHCDEGQVFLAIFRQITPAINQSIYCVLERCIQQVKHVPELK
jgi:hypothetical protein